MATRSKSDGGVRVLRRARVVDGRSDVRCIPAASHDRGLTVGAVLWTFMLVLFAGSGSGSLFGFETVNVMSCELMLPELSNARTVSV